MILNYFFVSIPVLSEGTEGKNTNAQGVLRALRCHGWVISAEEQDAHELFHALTSTLDDEIMQVRRQASSLLNVSWVDADQLKEGAMSCFTFTNGQTGQIHQPMRESAASSQPFIQPLQEQSSPLSTSNSILKDRITTSIISKVSSNLTHSRCLVTKSSLATLESPFKGHLASQLQCSVCGFKVRKIISEKNDGLFKIIGLLIILTQENAVADYRRVN